MFDKRRPVVEASMSGMINVGPVRDPLRTECEKCHMVGRWHGQIAGRIHLPKEEIGYLVGQIVMDVVDAERRGGFRPEFLVTLEGMIYRECGYK